MVFGSAGRPTAVRHAQPGRAAASRTLRGARSPRDGHRQGGTVARARTAPATVALASGSGGQPGKGHACLRAVRDAARGICHGRGWPRVPPHSPLLQKSGFRGRPRARRGSAASPGPVPRAPHVGVGDVGERDQLDGVNLDQVLARTDWVAARYRVGGEFGSRLTAVLLSAGRWSARRRPSQLPHPGPDLPPRHELYVL
jgi:hypothetical protein